MMCGIEIHQRLAGKKLFCNCVPSGKAMPPEGNVPQDAAHPAKENAATTFTRKIHAVRSELGELDSAVRLEAVRERAFQYTAPHSSSCLVEADEEPPRGLNSESLHAVLVFCNLLSSKPVDELQVMRKNVIDGSNTAGFQRTAVVGLGGGIKIPSGRLEIQAVCIEEESSGIIKGDETRAHYDLDRLGIPLVEIATAPTLKNGKDAQEAALAIGTLLRQTGLVQRGIGTIRQDLNISIPEGARVEIKGVQDIAIIEKTVELEVQRQKALLNISEKAKKQLSGKKTIEEFFDLTSIFSETKSGMASKKLKNGSKIIGMALPGFAGLLGMEIAPGRRLGTELADYARSAGIAGLIHSDEAPEKYGFSDDEISEVRAALSLTASDAFVIVIGDEKKSHAALCEVARRANFQGIPEETRRANPDGTSSYMRPLPGKARLYPETDVAPIEITEEMLETAKISIKKMEKMGDESGKSLSLLNDELRAQLSSLRGLISHNPAHKQIGATPELSVFMHATKLGIEPKYIASVLTNTLQSIKRESLDTQALDEERLLSLFKAFHKELFVKAATADMLRLMCKEKGISAEEAIANLELERISGKVLEKLISEEKLDLKMLMARYRLRVNAAEAEKLLKK